MPARDPYRVRNLQPQGQGIPAGCGPGHHGLTGDDGWIGAWRLPYRVRGVPACPPASITGNRNPQYWQVHAAVIRPAKVNPHPGHGNELSGAALTAAAGIVLAALIWLFIQAIPATA
jgi:hypothetical protein